MADAYTVDIINSFKFKYYLSWTSVVNGVDNIPEFDGVKVMYIFRKPF